MNTRQICFQIADAGLLDEDLTRAIKKHEDFDHNEVVDSLVFMARDSYAAVMGDAEASWQEKRLATGNLVAAFLAALALPKVMPSDGHMKLAPVDDVVFNP